MGSKARKYSRVSRLWRSATGYDRSARLIGKTGRRGLPPVLAGGAVAGESTEALDRLPCARVGTVDRKVSIVSSTLPTSTVRVIEVATRCQPSIGAGVTIVFPLRAVGFGVPFSNRTPDQKPPRKATLYCFNCDHESLIKGDWTVRANGDRVDYECPECETTITTRRRPDELTVSSEGVVRYSRSD